MRYRSLTNYCEISFSCAQFLMLVFNGFRYITAGGEEEQTTQAKNAMKWVAAGILTILLSYVIIKAAGALLGLS